MNYGTYQETIAAQIEAALAGTDATPEDIEKINALRPKTRAEIAADYLQHVADKRAAEQARQRTPAPPAVDDSGSFFDFLSNAVNQDYQKTAERATQGKPPGDDYFLKSLRNPVNQDYQQTVEQIRQGKPPPTPPPDSEGIGGGDIRRMIHLFNKGFFDTVGGGITGLRELTKSSDEEWAFEEWLNQKSDDSKWMARAAAEGKIGSKGYDPYALGGGSVATFAVSGAPGGLVAKGLAAGYKWRNKAIALGSAATSAPVIFPLHANDIAPR